MYIDHRKILTKESFYIWHYTAIVVSMLILVTRIAFDYEYLNFCYISIPFVSSGLKHTLTSDYIVK